MQYSPDGKLGLPARCLSPFRCIPELSTKGVSSISALASLSGGICVSNLPFTHFPGKAGKETSLTTAVKPSVIMHSIQFLFGKNKGHAAQYAAAGPLFTLCDLTIFIVHFRLRCNTFLYWGAVKSYKDANNCLLK